MIFSLKLWLAVFIFIDLFSAWWYAKGRDICKVVIFCTAAICGILYGSCVKMICDVYNK